MTTTAPPTLPTPILDGIRVLDLSRALPGRVACRLLAEVGAEVVAVEPPGGDPLRTQAPSAFASWNRSKEFWALDLDQPADRARLHSTALRADVVVHDLTAAEADQQHMTDVLAEAESTGVIVARVTGYPAGHPDAERPAREILVQARLGLMDEQQHNEGTPFPTRLPYASWGAAYLLFTGVLARLWQRACGRGSAPIDTSLMQGALLPASLFWHRAGAPPAWLARHTLPRDDAGAHLAIFECADGRWLQLHNGHTQQSEPGRPPARSSSTGGTFLNAEPVRRTLAELGMSDLAGARVTTANHARWAAVFRSRPRELWARELWAAGCVCMPVLAHGELFSLDQVRANSYAVAVDDPEHGTTVQSGHPLEVEPPATVHHGARRTTDALGADDLQWPPRSPSPCAEPATLPLDGIRVLDFGSFVAGPLAGQCLADLGADVVKIEAPGGEKGRTINQFTACNRGKRSVELDLRDPATRPHLERLVAGADIVVHNVREHSARGLGIDADSLLRINPRVVVAHSSAYGLHGPWSELPAFDATALALSGWTAGVAGTGRRPIWLRGSMMDCHTGLALTGAALLGLLHRSRTGRGSRVGTSLLAIASTAASESMLVGGTATSVDRPDPAETALSPTCALYQASDGWVAVSADTPLERAALQRLGHETPARWRYRPTADVLAELDAATIPAEAVRENWRDTLFDTELAADSGLVRRTPDTPYGWFDNPGGFWSAGGRVFRSSGRIPVVGSHTAELLGSRPSTGSIAAH